MRTRVNITLDAELDARIEATGEPRSHFIERACRELLDRESAPLTGKQRRAIAAELRAFVLSSDFLNS